MNAPQTSRHFGHDHAGLALRSTAAALTIQRLRDERHKHIIAYQNHKSNVAWARQRAEESAFAAQWFDLAEDELALAAYCRTSALNVRRKLAEWCP